MGDMEQPGLVNSIATSCGNSSVGRASACHAEGREFESRFPLKSVSIP